MVSFDKRLHANDMLVPSSHYPVLNMDSDILNIEEIVMGRGLPDPAPEVTPAKPAEPHKPIFKPPPAPTTYQHDNLQCFQCFITFCNAKAKERHMKKSHREEYKQQLQQGNTLFTCYVCDRSFQSSEELTQHQPTHSKEDKPFKCVHCKESFRVFSELTTHRRNMCPERQFVCKDCNETFRSPALLRTHRLAQHPRLDTEAGEQTEDPTKTHRCGRCSQGFETESELLVHQEKYSEGQHCNGNAAALKKRGRPPKTENQAAAEKKLKRVKEEGEATEETGKGSSTAESGAAPAEAKPKVAGAKRGRPPKAAAAAAAVAGEDQTTATEEAPAEEEKKASATPREHPCPECELTFPALAPLRAHKKEKHTPRKAHPCEECEESFARPEQLEAHKSRAHTEGRFSCPTCGKSFGRERTMKAHQKTHSDENAASQSEKR
ncbi:zinc finger protein 576.2 isoform X1 [Gadus chalcogrammus]|uniref:zinc finger protein 576.2 isoform X1 n=2 Tax=Gadus chalcogrammus TaxID=1042646 RepID=UPI0024C4A7A8|nr:zinc finger protein 576.2 isoform X1 [Gadus chalcogrammus]